jgi:hypothetical protein
MCNPAVSMGAQAFGVGMSSVGAYFSAKSQKATLRHQAAMAEINASIVDSNARNITRAGTIEESRIKLAGAQTKSSQRAQIAGSGIDIAGSNTALARLTGTDLITEVDAATIRSNALRAAWGQRMEASNLRRGAASMRTQASTISPFMSGATSLISGAGEVARSWYPMSKEDPFNTTRKQPTGTVSVEGGEMGDIVGGFDPYKTRGRNAPLNDSAGFWWGKGL